jgi:hypothetical protein
MNWLRRRIYDDELCYHGLQFARVPVLDRATRGTPFVRWASIGMPRIPPHYLDNVCYLYGDKEAARAGDEFGGTGFLVGIISEQFPQLGRYTYAITNWHVACQGSSVLRVNTVDGGVEIFPFGPEEWEFDPRYDIAAVPLHLHPEKHKFAILPAEALLTREMITDRKIGPGEDLFMIGRFVDHDGGQVNLPAVRFGNISVMPTMIEQPNGRMADSFCVDLHSRSGCRCCARRCREPLPCRNRQCP